MKTTVVGVMNSMAPGRAHESGNGDSSRGEDYEGATAVAKTKGKAQSLRFCLRSFGNLLG